MALPENGQITLTAYHSWAVDGTRNVGHVIVMSEELVSEDASEPVSEVSTEWQMREKWAGIRGWKWVERKAGEREAVVGDYDPYYLSDRGET